MISVLPPEWTPKTESWQQLSSMKHSIPPKIVLFYTSDQPGLTIRSQARLHNSEQGGGGWVTEVGEGWVPPLLPEDHGEAQPCIHDKRLN